MIGDTEFQKTMKKIRIELLCKISERSIKDPICNEACVRAVLELLNVLSKLEG